MATRNGAREAADAAGVSGVGCDDDGGPTRRDDDGATGSRARDCVCCWFSSRGCPRSPPGRDNCGSCCTCRVVKGQREVSEKISDVIVRAYWKCDSVRDWGRSRRIFILLSLGSMDNFLIID